MGVCGLPNMDHDEPNISKEQELLRVRNKMIQYKIKLPTGRTVLLTEEKYESLRKTLRQMYDCLSSAKIVKVEDVKPIEGNTWTESQRQLPQQSEPSGYGF
jgi:hypothetical protein